MLSRPHKKLLIINGMTLWTSGQLLYKNCNTKDEMLLMKYISNPDL